MKSRFLLLCALVILLWPKLCLAKSTFPFHGQLDLANRKLDLTVQVNDQTVFITNINKLSDNDYHLRLKFEHLKALAFDLSSEMEGSLRFHQIEDGISQFISGKIWSQYTLVDRKPIRELLGQFELRQKKLIIPSISFGDIKCSGSVDFNSPYKIDLVFDLTAIEMEDFLAFWSNSREFSAAGTVAGKIKVSGALDHLLLKGNLASFNGFVDKLQYDSFFLNMEGIYPHLQIASSTVSQSDGPSYTLDGPFNLSDQQSFKKQIENLTIAPLINDSGSRVEWTFKRLKDERSGTTEIKYLLRKDNASGDAFSKESDMLGVERRMEF